MRAATTLLVLALLGGPAFAQSVTLSGTVIDARTNRPLAAVRLSLDNQTEAVTSDADGRFQLTGSPGKHVVTASVIGFALLQQSVELIVGDTPDLTIRLSEGAGAFEEHVTVSGAGSTEHPADSGIALHGRDLQALRGVTLDDPLRAVQSLPSVSATDDFYGEFAVRGSPFSQVNLLVDGMPSQYLMHSVFGVTDGGSIAMINSDAVGSVSLFPGSYSQHAGRRVGARVDLDMREGDRDRVHVRMGLSGTSATMLAAGPLLRTRGSWLVSVRRSYLDLLLNRIEDGGNLAFGFTDGEAKVVLDLTPKHQLQLLALAGRSQFNEKPDDLGANDEATVTGHSWLTGFSWRFTPSPRLVATQRIYATGLAYLNQNRDSALLDDSFSDEIAWRGDASLSVARPLLINFGGDAQLLSGRRTERRALNDQPELRTIADYRAHDQARSAYAEAVAQVSSRATVTGGARFDDWGLTDTAVASPWVFMDLRVTPRTIIRAGSGLYRQFATFEQVNGLRGGGDNLLPETARHFDIGLTRTLRSDLALQATWFDRREQNLLWTPDAEPRRRADGSIQPGRGDAPWFNALDGRARGVELVLRRDAPSALSGWVAYAYATDRKTTLTGDETFWADFDQRHSLSLFGRYPLSNRTALGAKFRYGSNYPLLGYIGQQTSSSVTPLFGGDRPLFYQLVQSRNTLRLPNYARLDVRADRTFTWSRRRVTLFAEVANALNRRNLRNEPYGVDRSGRVFNPTGSLLPILPSAGFVIEF
jgi:hypothetical protein